MTTYLKQIQKDILHLFFPHVCEACGTELLGNERILCVSCWKDLPETKFHLQVNNPMEQKFFGRVAFEYGTAMYYFNKDSRIQEALHALKYRGITEVGEELGRRFGREIESCAWIKDIDVIIPVPLSVQKMKKRGYNQSEFIANGLAAVLNKEIDTLSLVRTKNTETQTRKTRAERLQNMQEAFEVVNPEALSNKHILLLDDVITTGATMESCAITLLALPGVKVSVASLAYAID